MSDYLAKLIALEADLRHRGIDAAVVLEAVRREQDRLARGDTFLCRCGASHDRGPVDGGNVYRCLRCGAATVRGGVSGRSADVVGSHRPGDELFADAREPDTYQRLLSPAVVPPSGVVVTDDPEADLAAQVDDATNGRR